ncbi:hypothetical protein [Amycolatopsis tucumanensis]|uniref:Uncharacterized protein n=1 Tax=Amycolatopsis tucumanensis TaxID=401106 RepID=A0ABP7HD68_9PSEU|nr:hypothetical protein [Amycolatopsis tucumanensis]MCF6423681.1 hypothetical protein [Amycolatopsis tucumanensis]
MPEAAIETEALVKTLSTMAGNLPIAILQLREGEMPPNRQRALGSLLIDLGTLVQQHADLEPPTPRPGA